MIAERVTKEINARLGFLLDVGLDYLTLVAVGGTLAGGEAQRIRLASQIGSGLVGTLYVLDEPSIGLHQRDNRRLIDTLTRLRDLGNTVIVVEHDEETIRESDWMVDIGPGAGEHGGEIVYSGPVAGISKVTRSITGRYLSGREQIPVPAARRPLTGEVLEIQGARQHNLRDIDVTIPLGNFVTVTGVSGSGKSTLVRDILLPVLMQRIYTSKTPPGKHRRVVGLELLDKVIDMDQSPIGRTPRSNPATYTGVFDSIRKLFAATNEAKVRGYLPGRFSFNVKGGRCEACAGDGTIKIEMHFLPDVYVPCEVCKGARYNRDTLDIEFKGHNIADVLDMPIAEAVEFFANQPSIARYMHTLMDVGLGYVRLGQPAPTLVGRRGPARQAGHRARQALDRAHDLPARRADHRAALRRRPPAAHGAVAARRSGQHRARDRAQPRRHQDRRLAHRPRPRGWKRWRHGRRRGPAGARRHGGDQPHRPLPARVARHLNRKFRCERSAAAPHPLRQLVEPRLLGAGEAVHPQLGDLVEDRVELGLIGRRLRRRRGLVAAATRSDRCGSHSVHGPATTSPPPRRDSGCFAVDRCRRRPCRRPPIGSAGIHGKLPSRPIERAVMAATARATNRNTMPCSLRSPSSWRISMPRITAPITQPGIPKKNRTNGYSATNSKKTQSSTGRIPYCGRSIRERDDGRDHGHQPEEHGEADAAEEPFHLGAEVPEHREHDHQPDVRGIGDRPRGDPPDLTVEDEVGHQDQLAEDVVVGALRAPRRSC